MLSPVQFPGFRRWSRHRRSAFNAFLRGGIRYFFGKRGQRRVGGLRMFYKARLLVLSIPGVQQHRFAGIGGVRVWVDGSEAFPRLEKLIGRARHTVVIQMFIWKDDRTGRRLARKLLEAADRGVHVEITKESAGDVFELSEDFLGTKGSDMLLWKRFWSHPRIRITHAADRDHAKVYVIDDGILLLTGINVSDDSYEQHDYMVELRGTEFVEQYLARRAPTSPDAAVRVVMNTEEHALMRHTVTRLLRSATHSVVVEHCYLSDPEILKELAALSRRGIAVTLILPDRVGLHHHANMASVGYLLTEADMSLLRVLLYPGMFHGKVILVDHREAFVGSANLMKSSLDDMGEVNVLISGNRRALWKLRETLRTDVLKCRPVTTSPTLVWFSRWLAWLGL